MSDFYTAPTHEQLQIKGLALDAIPHGVLIADASGLIIYANEAFLAITGYSRCEVIGHNCRFLQGPLTDSRTVSAIRYALANRAAFKGEVLNYRKDGSTFWNEISISPLRIASADVTFFIGTMQDISARTQAEAALRESEQRLQLALLGGNLGLWDWQFADGRLTVNQRWMTMLGLDPDGPAPSIERWTALVHPDDRPKLERLVEDVILNPSGRDFEAEVRARHADGRFIWILDKGAVVERDAQGRPVRVSGTHLDISERKEADSKMHRLAYYDTLTGLPNRSCLHEHLVAALAAAQGSSREGALMLVDIDNFKQINDARGHQIGDLLLQQMAHRLSTLSPGKTIVARLGGDEFVVLLDDIDVGAGPRAAMTMADQVHSALSPLFRVDDISYVLTASIGVTLFPGNGERVDDLLREADTAMYSAKANGRNRTAFFEPAMYRQAEERLAMEHTLAEAVAARQFTLHAEPRVDRKGREQGCELLLRWMHPLYGNVAPARFIPVAEATGQIIPLGEWVIEQACRALLRLAAAGCEHTLSVNVSPRQFHHDDFVGQVCGIVQHSGAPAGRLIFEITEGVLIENWETAAARMAKLAELGIRFSIDDFGTGYSSLAYLKRLPIYELKIDRSFVQDIADDASDRAIVQSILLVAHHLDLHVCAEGVETQAQADFLKENGCGSMQGYLFGRPMPLEAWLASACRGAGPGHLPRFTAP